MKNDYKITGDTVETYLNRGFKTVIDLADFEKINSHHGKWHAHTVKPSGLTYASTNDYTTGKQKTLRMHNFIMDTPKGYVADHRDNDTLNNRRSNLRNITRAQNNQNKRKNYKSKSGVRGVTWSSQRGKWCARVRHLGKCHYVGFYDTVKEAAQALERERPLILKYSDERGGIVV